MVIISRSTFICSLVFFFFSCSSNKSEQTTSWKKDKYLQKADSILLYTDLFDDAARERAYTEIIILYNKSLETNFDLNTLELKLDFYLKSNAYLEAVKVVEELIAYKPDNGKYHLIKGLLHRKLNYDTIAKNSFETANQLFAKALSSKDSNSQINYYCTMLLLKGEEFTVNQIEKSSLSQSRKSEVKEFVKTFNIEGYFGS